MANQNSNPLLKTPPKNSGWHPPMNSAHFWEFRAAVAEDGSAVPDTIELVIYGSIAQTSWWGDEVTPKQFDAELRANSTASTIVVRINSGGGDIFAAQAIGARLKDSGKKTVCKIDGICGSAATVIASYCDHVIIANGGNYMAHLPAVGLNGYYNEVELSQFENACKKIKDSIIAVYMAKCGKTREEVEKIINETTWWNAQETVDNGFADELMFAPVEVARDATGTVFVNSVPIAMTADKLPETVKNALQAPAAPHFLDKQHESEVKTMPNNASPAAAAAATLITTVDALRREYPDLCNQIEQAATNAERTRIKDLEELNIAGAESVINAAKFEKPASAQETAMQIVNAMKAAGTGYANMMQQDVADSGVNGVKNEAQPAGGKGDLFTDALHKLFPAKE